MRITIYCDLIFFINFIVDLFVLYGTGVLLKQKINYLKLLIGAIFGSGMLLGCMFTPLFRTEIGVVTTYFGISMGAVWIVYGRKALIQKWFLSTTIMVLIGGFMNYIKYVTGENIVSLIKWCILFGESTIVLIVMIKWVQKVLIQGKQMYLIKLRHGKRLAVEKVLLDTGNMLEDPLFGKPVIILSEEVVRQCLSEEEIYVIEQYRESGRLNYNKLLTNYLQKTDCFHEIAYQSVGNPSGKLLCMLFEEIVVAESGKILYKQPVAICSSKLFVDKSYKGLLHKECI